MIYISCDNRCTPVIFGDIERGAKYPLGKYYEITEELKEIQANKASKEELETAETAVSQKIYDLDSAVNQRIDNADSEISKLNSNKADKSELSAAKTELKNKIDENFSETTAEINRIDETLVPIVQYQDVGFVVNNGKICIEMEV